MSSTQAEALSNYQAAWTADQQNPTRETAIALNNATHDAIELNITAAKLEATTMALLDTLD